MKQNTKETIGSRGTVAGFRPLIGEERWHKDSFTAEMLEGGWRPLLDGEAIAVGDQWHTGMTWLNREHFNSIAVQKSSKHRTKRPLPPPQVETFEAHGHVWYRHVPGDAQPVESNVDVFVLFDEMDASSSFDYAGAWDWGFYDNFRGNIIGYRFPNFPAVHTTLQQQQTIVTPVGPMKAVEATDTTKQHLLTMYNGWCDVAPDSVAECIADVAKVLYPTDADRCEAEFQKWYRESKWYGSGYVEASDDAWKTAWNAAKQQNP
jgi:hypothetical protein